MKKPLACRVLYFHRLLSTLFLASFLLALPGCNITKKIFRKKEITQTKTTSEATVSKISESDSTWQWSGSSLLRRDGTTRIDFSGDPVITFSPDQSIQISGGSPTIHRFTTEIRKDTSTIMGSSSSRFSQDSTGSSTQKKEKKVLETQRDKEQKVQKIGPILVLLLLLLLLFLAGRFFKLI